MTYQRLFRSLLLAVIGLILLSPLVYWATGIGQAAAGLSAEIMRQADGTLVSSPKAEALHQLSLTIRLERLLLYPLLLGSFLLSGGSHRLRGWLEERLAPGLSRRLPWLSRLAWPGRWLPLAWRLRLREGNLWVVFSFVVALQLALALLYLPFNFYQGFILAHQFGLSTQTALAWGSDWVKSLLIDLVLDGLLWTGFYALLRLFPQRWPIPAGGLSVVLSAIFVLLTPVLITPLFYRVEPLADPDLRGRILALAGRAGMRVEAVEVIDASAKTTQVNAYFTGFGGAQRIVLYDTLLTGYTPDQIEVVLAHEMGHWYYQHVLLAIVGSGAAGWLGLFGLRWLLQKGWPRLNLAGPADVAGLPYILLIFSLASLLAMPVENGISRYAEGQADAFALAMTQKPAAFIQLFEKFAGQNLSVVDVPEWEEFLFYTHPTLAERIGGAERFLAQQVRR